MLVWNIREHRLRSLHRKLEKGVLYRVVYDVCVVEQPLFQRCHKCTRSCARKFPIELHVACKMIARVKSSALLVIMADTPDIVQILLA